jgi:hypothetical protein
MLGSDLCFGACGVTHLLSSPGVHINVRKMLLCGFRMSYRDMDEPVQQRMAEVFAYVDSSSDEEGPEDSLYWQLPKGHRRHYKPVLQAMRRARVRRSYIQYLTEHGFHVTNQPAPTSKDECAQKLLGPGHAEGGIAQGGPGCIKLPMVGASEAVIAVLQEHLPREHRARTIPVPDSQI